MNVQDVRWQDDRWVVRYLDAVAEVGLALKSQESEIKNCVFLLFSLWKQDRWLFVAGNGGSASTATHLAADLVKTVVGAPGQRGLKAVALVDNIPLASAAANDWGWSELFRPMLETYWQPGSVVMAISVHGGAGQDQAGAWSQNLLRAIQFVKDHGGKTIALTGFDGGAMKELCDVCIVVPADSTPLVESFHVVLHHMIAFRLKAMIADHISRGG
ncbi:MAG: SIS domain-containing protein [Patescibacteria group bacterium]